MLLKINNQYFQTKCIVQIIFIVEIEDNDFGLVITSYM